MLSILAVVFSVAIFAPATTADTLPSTTLPLQNNEEAWWMFSGNAAVGIQPDRKGDGLTGRFQAFSLTDSKPLWQSDQALGNEKVASQSSVVSSRDGSDWYVGTGPFSCVDATTGATKWTANCQQLGYVNPNQVRAITEDRLLLVGTKKCDPADSWEALKEPRISVVDSKTGRIVWSHDTKSLEYETKLGYWARVAKWQGRGGSGDKHRQFMTFLVTPANLFLEEVTQAPTKVVLAGERLEILNVADGSIVHQSKDKPGILRGAADGLLFFRKGDDMTAYRASTGEVAWTFDLKKKGGRVYTLDDLEDMGHGVPKGMNDILVSEVDVVSRVATQTGKALFTVNRGGGMGWQATAAAFLTRKEDKIIAYDWNNGAKLWETKALSKAFILDAGSDYLLVVGGEGMAEGGIPIPPYKLAALNAKTGQVLWTKKDLNGKKIAAYELMEGGLVRVESEAAASIYRVADGAAADDAAAGATAGGTGNLYVSILKKGMQCRDAAGKLVWERKGERGVVPRDQPRNGLAIWAAADGTVEVIGAADGQTKWTGKVDKDPRVVTNADWSYMVVQNKSKKEVTIVKLAP